MKKLWNAGFLAAVFLLLICGAIRTVFAPDAVNEYENRTANQIETPTAEAVFSGSFQKSCEDALTDQVFGAITMKKCYNDTTARFYKLCAAQLETAYSEHYVSLNGVYLFSGSMTRAPIVLQDERETLDRHIADIQGMCSAVPDTDAYLYYVERDADINFETGEKSGVYEYLETHLRDSFDGISRFEVSSLDRFQSDFFKYDHHWNCNGSYQGYTEVLRLLLPDAVPLEPSPLTPRLLGTWSGSRALSSGTAAMYSEPFYAYHFDFPEMTIRANGVSTDSYVRQDDFPADGTTPVSYGAYYGADCGELIFDTGHPERDNLLVLGESYDNAILQLLASHFGTTCSVDLRYYAYYTGSSFSVADYIQAHNIDKILVIGSSSYFDTDSFLVGN